MHSQRMRKRARGRGTHDLHVRCLAVLFVIVNPEAYGKGWTDGIAKAGKSAGMKLPDVRRSSIERLRMNAGRSGCYDTPIPTPPLLPSV